MVARERIFSGRANSPFNRSCDSKGEPKQSFLIICEGEQTEPNYFNGFKLTSARVVAIGRGANTESLICEAIRIRDERKSNDDEFDQIWCVFDRDAHPKDQFNNAFQLAAKENIKIAYSNQAFELWYVLHFNFLDTGIDRRQYIEILTRELGRKYKKNSTEMYDLLLSKQSKAIQNATKLLSRYRASQPEKDDPSTSVHVLVSELNRFL